VHERGGSRHQEAECRGAARDTEETTRGVHFLMTPLLNAKCFDVANPNQLSLLWLLRQLNPNHLIAE
jgi:hypothetical protein